MKVNIKKLKINKVLKIISIVAAVVMLCALSFLLYKEAKIPEIEEKKVTVYSYKHKSSTDYQVLLKPNSLYSSPTLNEGQFYIANYVDQIQNTFNYEFKGDRPANIKGSYEIAAVVEGYTIVEKEHITVWEKKYTLVPKTDFEANSDVFSISETVSIDLDEYNDFVAMIVKESNVSIPMQLNLYMDVRLKADTAKGSAEVQNTPGIVVPLDARYFLITESDDQEIPGSIEETQRLQLPPDILKIRIFISGIAVLLIVLTGLVFFTEAIRKSPFTIKLEKIFKHHGSRLVALSSELLAEAIENCSIVRSIEDLVRVADEIGRPIMYEYSEEYRNMYHFYVIDEKRTYVYILRDDSDESNITMVDEKEIAL